MWSREDGCLILSGIADEDVRHVHVQSANRGAIRVSVTFDRILRNATSLLFPRFAEACTETLRGTAGSARTRFDDVTMTADGHRNGRRPRRSSRRDARDLRDEIRALRGSRRPAHRNPWSWHRAAI